MEAQPKSGLSKTLYCIHCTKLAKMSFDGIFDLTAVLTVVYSIFVFICIDFRVPKGDNSTRCFSWGRWVWGRRYV